MPEIVDSAIEVREINDRTESARYAHIEVTRGGSVEKGLLCAVFVGLIAIYAVAQWQDASKGEVTMKASEL